MPTTLVFLIESFVEAMDSSASISDLRSIRDKMDSWLFRENVSEFLQRINDPLEIARLLDLLRRLQRDAEDLASQRSNVRELFRIGGVGGGISLVSGGILAALTTGSPAALIIPIVGTAVVVWQALVHSNQSSKEIGLLQQIAETARDLADRRNI